MNQSDADSAALARQPDSNGIWTFVFIDMIVFSLIFLVFLSEKLRLPAVFASGQAHLDFRFGLANTIVLLVSSLFMAEAVSAIRGGSHRRMRRQLALCLACGAVFCLNKVIEYHGEITAGFTPAHNSFFSFYYFITGAHFLHVAGAMIFIAHSFVQPAGAALAEGFRRKVENTGLFWHFVDLLWIFIFPLLYLARSA